MIGGRRILANTSFLLGASIFNLIISLLTTTIVARSIGPDLYGRYTFGLNFILIFSVLSNFGLESLYIREAARDQANLALIGDIFRIKMFLAFATALATIGASYLLDYPVATLEVICILAIGQIFQILSESLLSVHRAMERMEIPALASILFRVISAAVIVASVYSGVGFYGVVSAYTASNVLVFLWVAFITRLHIPVRLPPGFAQRAFVLIRRGAPFYQSALLAMFYTKISVILLAKFASESEMGFYMAGLTLVETLYFIPTAFITAVFPAFSRIYGKSSHLLQQSYGRIVKYLMILTAAIVVGTLFVTDEVIALIFGQQFMPAAPVLRILIFTWAFTFFSQVLSTLLFSIGKERIQVRLTVFACLTNLALTWVLLVQVGYLGAAVASVLTETLVVVATATVLWRLGYRIQPVRFVLQLTLALTVMAVAVWFLLEIHVVVAIMAGGGAFLLGLFVFRVFDETDRRFLEAVTTRSSRIEQGD